MGVSIRSVASAADLKRILELVSLKHQLQYAAAFSGLPDHPIAFAATPRF